MYRKLLFCWVGLVGSGFYLNNYKPTLFLVGDSTVSTFADRYAPMTGWGHEFYQFFSDDITVDNRAIAGKSSRSFIEEGKWDQVVRDIRKGDYLFIQFGHNDQKRDHRYTSPYTTYKEFLTKYVRDTRRQGGIPILVTSVMRRRFNRHGKLYDTHGDYPKAVRQLADELDVPLIDLHQRSFVHFGQLGKEATKKTFLWLKPGEAQNYPQGIEDNTHFSRYGAQEVGKLVVAGLKTLDLPLKNYLKGHQPPCEEEVAESMTICQGDSVYLNGRYRTRSGTYRVDMGTQEGCHKTRVVSLTVNPVSASSQTITLCAGESRVLGGRMRRTSGTYYDTYHNRLGCDSVVTTRLIVHPVHDSKRTWSMCQGDSVRIGGCFRAKAGEYRTVYQSRQGCDSILVTTLLVAHSITTPTVVADQDTLRSSVLGDTYQWFLDEQVLEDTTARLVPLQEGSYSVVVGVGACKSSPSEPHEYTAVVTATRDVLSGEEPLRVYRADSGPYLTVEALAIAGPAKLYIHDVLGNAVYRSVGQPSWRKIPFAQPKGVYMVTLVEANRRTSVKFYW